jgi:predicted nucleic acid-binding protein
LKNKGDNAIEKILVDTSFWKGMFDKEDQYHNDGKKLLEWILKQKKYEIWITNLILAEIGNWLKKVKTTSSNFLRYILKIQNLNVIYDDEKYLPSIIELFEKFDHSLGYVDSFNTIVYFNKKMKYIISHDSDYDRIKDMVRLTDIPIEF